MNNRNSQLIRDYIEENPTYTKDEFESFLRTLDISEEDILNLTTDEILDSSFFDGDNMGDGDNMDMNDMDNTNRNDRNDFDMIPRCETASNLNYLHDLPDDIKHELEIDE